MALSSDVKNVDPLWTVGQLPKQDPVNVVVTAQNPVPVVQNIIQPALPELGAQPVYKTGWRPAMGWAALAAPLVDMALQFVGAGQMDKITLVCTTVLGIASIVMRGIERVKGRA